MISLDRTIRSLIVVLAGASWLFSTEPGLPADQLQIESQNARLAKEVQGTYGCSDAVLIFAFETQDIRSFKAMTLVQDKKKIKAILELLVPYREFHRDSSGKLVSISRILSTPRVGLTFFSCGHSVGSVDILDEKHVRFQSLSLDVDVPLAPSNIDKLSRVVTGYTSECSSIPDGANKSVESTPTAVTPAADAPGAPSAGVPHHYTLATNYETKYGSRARSSAHGRRWK